MEFSLVLFDWIVNNIIILVQLVLRFTTCTFLPLNLFRLWEGQFLTLGFPDFFLYNLDSIRITPASVTLICKQYSSVLTTFTQLFHLGDSLSLLYKFTCIRVSLCTYPSYFYR